MTDSTIVAFHLLMVFVFDSLVLFVVGALA